jgi:ATP synthase protein I
MKRETGKNLRELGYFASLGISVALSIFIGLGLGLWLDKKFETDPVLMFVGLALVIVAGFSNIIRAGRKGKNY